MKTKRQPKQVNNFIDSAKEDIEKRGRGASIFIDSFANREDWLENKDIISWALHFNGLTDYYVNYTLLHPENDKIIVVQKSLEYQDDAIIKIKRIDYNNYPFVQIEILLAYINNYSLISKIVKNEFNKDLLNYSKELFSALWEKLTTDRYANPDNFEKYKAYELIHKLLVKDYSSIINEYDAKFKFDLMKYENSNRTIIKEVYLLSKVAMKSTDDVENFGADTLNVLIKYFYYLWIVNEDISAKIDLPVVCLITLLHSEIRGISKTNSFDLFKSLQPEIVIADMINIKNA